MRPIDANSFAVHVALYMAENAYLNDTALDVLKKVSNWLEEEPIIDFAPVKRGEWVDEIEPNAVTASGREVHVFRCSACDFTWANKTAVLHYFKYCPNCGARMDGGKKHD